MRLRPPDVESAGAAGGPAKGAQVVPVSGRLPSEDEENGHGPDADEDAGDDARAEAGFGGAEAEVVIEGFVVVAGGRCVPKCLVHDYASCDWGYGG